MERSGNRKRKISEILLSCEEGGSSRFPLNELNQDLLERVLSWLPTSSFLRLNSVCKKWKSVADSSSFKLACSQVPSREPWFFMVDFHQPNLTNHPIVFDSSEGNWKKLNPLPLFYSNQSQDSCSNFMPVCSSGGFICFRNQIGDLIVTNPVTGSTRPVPSPEPVLEQPIQAIAMKSSKSHSFKIVLVSGELSKLKFREYNSVTDQWGQETSLARRTAVHSPVPESNEEEFTQYFLSKCGNVVSTDIQRNPCKQYSSLLTIKNGEELLHFLSPSGTVVCCNLNRKFMYEYPRLLPVFSEYSIDLVECGGEVYVVLLSEFLESASLRLWRWDERNRSWFQIAAMPPAMSHKLYGKNVDLNCSGAGKKIMVCLNSVEMCSYVWCDLYRNEWVELPDFCCGEREFVCAFSFEPRIEVST